MELAVLRAVLRTPVPGLAAPTSTVALERARQHMLAELRLVGQLTEMPPPVHLQLCS